MLNLLVSLVAEYADFVTMLFGKLYLRVFLLILLTSLFFASHMAKLTDETFTAVIAYFWLYTLNNAVIFLFFMWYLINYPFRKIVIVLENKWNMMQLFLKKVVEQITYALLTIVLRGCLHETQNEIYPKRNFNPP